MKNVFTFFVFAFISFAAMAQGSWAQLANFPGGARYGATSAVIDDKVYFGLGGYLIGVDFIAYNDWWEYDQATDTWTRKADYPFVQCFAVSVVINGKCYVGFGSDFEKKWYEYDPNEDTWTKKASFPGKQRYGVSAFTIDSIGYICLGNEGTDLGPFSKKLWSYNPTTDTWIQKAPLPAKDRYYAVGFSINGKGYVEGGVRKNQASKYKYFDDLWEYDPVSDAWTQKTSFPGGNKAAEACFVINDKAYIGLGVQQGNYNRTFYSYDPSTDTWQDSIAEFGGDGREVACSFAINDIGYVALGYNPNKQGYYDDVWQFTPSSSPRNSETKETLQESFVRFTQLGNTLISFFNLNEKNSSFNFKFYDVSGRLLQSQTIGEGSIIYLDATLPKGIYLAVTSDGKKDCTQKILIQ